MDACENAIAAMTGAPKEPAAEAPIAGGSVAASAQEEAKLSRQERAELVALKAEKQKRLEEEQITKLAAEMTERTELEAKLVKSGRETPATVKLLSASPSPTSASA
jgi:hypothetical protein